MPQASVFSTSWQGSLIDLANIVHQIRRSHAFGRLSLRNAARLSIAHLYFHAGRLVHVVGNRGDASAVLRELQEWHQAAVRFDRGVTTADVTVNADHEQLLTESLSRLYQRGLVVMAHAVSAPGAPRVVESDLVVKTEARQLITPWEWRLLMEATRRISFVLAHLVGALESLKVMRDILEDCSAAFPAFTSLKVAPSGYLHVTDRTPLDHMSREELLEGFAALIAACQLFCASLVGEHGAHRLMVQALHDIGPALVSLGVFRIDRGLLALRSS